MAEPWNDVDLCTQCGGLGRDWRTHATCAWCINGEPLGPRLVHRKAEAFARERARDPWYNSLHAP